MSTNQQNQKQSKEQSAREDRDNKVSVVRLFVVRPLVLEVENLLPNKFFALLVAILCKWGQR